MRIYARAFATPKAGNDEAEYEDAFQPLVPIEGAEGDVFRSAVADGATEASYSGIWARQLVAAYADGRLGTPSTIAEDLVPLTANWGAAIGDKPLPWYAESKARSGAFSTLVGSPSAPAVETARRFPCSIFRSRQPDRTAASGSKRTVTGPAGSERHGQEGDAHVPIRG